MALCLSLYRPVVTVDEVDGQWYAIVFNGANHFKVVDWPLLDHPLEARAGAPMLRVELFLAADAGAFLRGEARSFAEVLVPLAEVRAGPRAGLFRRWLGLQRGVRPGAECATDALAAARRFEAGGILARNLLAPKLCCSVVGAGLLLSQPAASAAAEDSAVATLQQTVAQHSDIIIHMHQQLRALWAQGALAAARGPDGELGAHLAADVTLKEAPGACLGHAGVAKVASRLRSEVQGLVDQVKAKSARLAESRRLRLGYRRKLQEATGERLPGDEEDDGHPEESDASPPDGNAEPDPVVDGHGLQRDIRRLEEAWRAEHARAESLHWQLQEEASSGAPSQERRGGRGLAPHGGGDGGSGRSTASSPQVAALQEELRLQTSRLVESWAAQADTAAGCAPERRVAGAVSKETRGDDHPSSAEAEIRLLQEQVGRSSAELRRQEQRESELRREVERLTTQLERLRPAAGPGERRQSAGAPREAEEQLHRKIRELEEINKEYAERDRIRCSDLGAWQESAASELVEMRSAAVGGAAAELAALREANARLRQELAEARESRQQLLQGPPGTRPSSPPAAARAGSARRGHSPRGSARGASLASAAGRPTPRGQSPVEVVRKELAKQEYGHVVARANENVLKIGQELARVLQARQESPPPRPASQPPAAAGAPSSRAGAEVASRPAAALAPPCAPAPAGPAAAGSQRAAPRPGAPATAATAGPAVARPTHLQAWVLAAGSSPARSTP